MAIRNARFACERLAHNCSTPRYFFTPLHNSIAAHRSRFLSRKKYYTASPGKMQHLFSDFLFFLKKSLDTERLFHFWGRDRHIITMQNPHLWGKLGISSSNVKSEISSGGERGKFRILCESHRHQQVVKIIVFPRKWPKMALHQQKRSVDGIDIQSAIF